jgi:organic hydroperoxide reductase OsmC/OhrA
VLYSNHEHWLILVVDDVVRGRAASAAWTRERASTAKLRSITHRRLAQGASMKQHNYEVRIDWTGNDGVGTKTYKGYRRDHTITSPGKPQIEGSSDPNFRGDRSRYNPEELLVASLSACHMLWYLHLCSANQVTVLDYHDAALGVMRENEDGSGEFLRVTLKPAVKISAGNDRAKALALHSEAHHLCFIARSVNFPVEVTPEIAEATGPAA